MTKIDKVLTLFRGIAERDGELATQHLDPDRYVEHDPHVEDGVEGVRRYVGALGPDERLEVIRAYEDGDLVVTQADGQVRGDGTFFDVFRFDGDRVVEHWGFAAPAGPPNRSGHTQVDGPTEAGRDEDTAHNKAFIREYYEQFHLAGRHDLADHYFGTSPMLRHEPGVADGVGSFLADLQLLKRDRTIDELRLIAGRGGMFFIAALGTYQDEPCAYVDLYRVENDVVMEHWGFFQMVPPDGERRNANAML